jgi:hypothetical protein
MQVESTHVGQFIEVDPSAHPDLAGQRLLITQVIGKDAGDHAMLAVRGDRGLVTGLGGRLTRYIRADETRPARAEPGPRPRVTEREKPTMQMSLEAEVLNLANDYEKKYGLTKAEAAKRASAAVLTTPEKADSYRGLSSAREPVRSLEENEVRTKLLTVARENNISVEDAAEVIRCDAGAERFRQRVMTLRASGLDAVAAIRRASEESPADAEHYRAAGLL